MVIHFDPIVLELLMFLAFFCFVIAGPILIVVALVLTLRRPTRRVGLVMLLSGVAGFFCIAAAVVLRMLSRAPITSQVHWPGLIVPSVAYGLAGFAAFVTVATLFYFRYRRA